MFSTITCPGTLKARGALYPLSLELDILSPLKVQVLIKQLDFSYFLSTGLPFYSSGMPTCKLT